MAETAPGGKAASRTEAVGGAVAAVVWLGVLVALALYPFHFPVNLHHGFLPSNYGLLWSGWSLLGLGVAGFNLIVLTRRKPKALPACALALVLGTCLVECPMSGSLYQRWEARYVEMGWVTLKPQFEAIVKHVAQDRAAPTAPSDAKVLAGPEEPYPPNWDGIEKLIAPEWRWRGRCMVFPGTVDRVVFYWPQGHMDLNRVIVYDPSGDLLKAAQSGQVTAEKNPALAGFFKTGGFRYLNECRRVEGDYYFCEFRY